MTREKELPKINPLFKECLREVSPEVKDEVRKSMDKEIEDYIRSCGWIFAGVSQPDHRRQWAKVKDDKVMEIAFEDNLIELALEVVEK